MRQGEPGLIHWQWVVPTTQSGGGRGRCAAICGEGAARTSAAPPAPARGHPGPGRQPRRCPWFFHNSRTKQFFVTTVPPQLDSSQIAKIDHGFLQKPAAFLCFCPPPAPWTAHRASLLHQRVRARTGALPRWLPRGSCIHAFPFQAPSTPRSVCHPALPIRHVCGLLEHSREAVRMLMICCRSSTLLLCWLHRSRADQFQKP